MPTNVKFNRNGATTMNKPAAIVSVGVGVAFFALQSMFPISMLLEIPIFDSIGSLLASEKSKARAAVSKHLINPLSAEFDALRAVEVEKARYVCGMVNGKNRSGSYAGYRAFVYDVRIDYARIDDDGTISKSHGAFKQCPVAEEENKSLPQALEMAKKLAKSLPQKDPKDLLKSDLLKPVPGSQSADALTSGAQEAPKDSLQAGKSGAPGGVSTQKQSFTTTLGNEGEWRSDKPPLAWPKFPAGDPLNEPSRRRTNSEVISFAADVDERWTSYKAGRNKAGPAASEITEALRALLSIAPESAEFPRAWSLFVRLRKADREVNANRAG